MSNAKINETCIIGLPTCGYAFSSSRMAFIAAPSDEDSQFEIDLLETILEEKEYEAYVALRDVKPGKFAFCTKICSKIITSQFCIAVLNPSSHSDDPKIKIPNPNVHMEYGLMLAFKKHIIPFQKEGDQLAFNVQPLDTIKYKNSTFKKAADKQIDAAILEAGTTSRPMRSINDNELISRYLAVRGLTITDVSGNEANTLYQLGNSLSYYLLDGQDIVYFGLFELESAKEVAFRLKLLLQNLHLAYQRFDTITSRTISNSARENGEVAWNRIKIEIIVSDEIDKSAIRNKVDDLTREFRIVPWKLLNSNDLEDNVSKEFDLIGEI